MTSLQSRTRGPLFIAFTCERLFPMTSAWYQDFFQGPVVEFWRRAVSPEHTQAELAWIRRHGRVAPGSRVLDVPCGTGRHSIPLAQAGCLVTGIDISAESLAIARADATASGASVNFVEGDMAQLDFPAGFETALMLGNSFGYLEHDVMLTVLSKIATALAPGGRLLLDTGTVAEALLPNYQPAFQIDVGDIRLGIENRYDTAASRLLTRYTVSQHGEVRVLDGTQGTYTCAELQRLLAAVGLRVIACYGSLEDKPFELGDRCLYLVAERV
jgi:SAM-dependent methyltransferase